MNNRHQSVEKIQQMLASPEPVKWLFMGDSIAQGALHTMGHRDYPQHFGERVRWELRRTQDCVINNGR
jgi:acyl-CoA thioesterase-1